MKDPSPTCSIETVGLCKTFGAIQAVDRLSIQVREGESVALFGSNGAGKQSYLYDDLTARQNLEFYARIFGAADPRGRTEQLLEAVGLAARADDPVGTFSRGMQQRASLARALVHEPRIVFLDEPFTGLDPHGARTLRETLDRLREERRTVFMVTHNLTQGLELSDRWIILARGRIVDQGRSAEADPAMFEREYFDRLESARTKRARP
jgi:heme exporter protein A